MCETNISESIDLTEMFSMKTNVRPKDLVSRKPMLLLTLFGTCKLLVSRGKIGCKDETG